MALRDDIMKILAPQMGPAAAPFLYRQCKLRLKKEAVALTKTDIPELARWIGVGVALVLGEGVAATLSQRVLAIQ
jgi:hypothetical protein